MGERMKHYNGNFPCVFDTETTGFDPRIFDIVSFCCLPLDPIDLTIHNSIGPFELSLKPKRPENIDFEAIRIQRQNNDCGQADDIIYVKEKIIEHMTRGLEPDFASELFVEWFENLKLKPGKKLIPIAHNWPFDREHIIEWLGYKTFDYIFHPYYRDTMTMSLFENDVAEWHGEPYPYQHHKVSTLCQSFGIKRDRKHTALDDCVDTAAIFRNMIKKQIPLKPKEVDKQTYENPTFTIKCRPESNPRTES